MSVSVQNTAEISAVISVFKGSLNYTESVSSHCAS